MARESILWLLRSTSRDVLMTNPWSGQKMRVNTYQHKNYWFYGKDRERSTMNLFSEYIRPGDIVIEMGAHIGFMSQLFSELVGDEGRVVVFEPGSNNLPYLRPNVANLHNVTIEELAVSDFDGEATFFEDDITGQNNSLLADYEGLNGVAGTHGTEARRTERLVPVVTLDSYTREHDLKVDFIKIDIEGNELAALRGATQTLRSVRIAMVEVTENFDEVAEILVDAGFILRSSAGEPVLRLATKGNYFAIRDD